MLALVMLAAAAPAIDLSPIVSLLVQIAALVLTGIVGWLATRIAAYFHVSTQSALFQNVLGAVDRGINYGQQVVAARGTAVVNTAAAKLAQNNAVAAEATNYVVSKLPGTLSQLGLTPAHVADLVTSKLPPPPGAPTSSAAA